MNKNEELMRLLGADEKTIAKAVEADKREARLTAQEAEVLNAYVEADIMADGKAFKAAAEALRSRIFTSIRERNNIEPEAAIPGDGEHFREDFAFEFAGGACIIKRSGLDGIYVARFDAKDKYGKQINAALGIRL